MPVNKESATKGCRSKLHHFLSFSSSSAMFLESLSCSTISVARWGCPDGIFHSTSAEALLSIAPNASNPHKHSTHQPKQYLPRPYCYLVFIVIVPASWFHLLHGCRSLHCNHPNIQRLLTTNIEKVASSRIQMLLPFLTQVFWVLISRQFCRRKKSRNSQIFLSIANSLTLNL